MATNSNRNNNGDLISAVMSGDDNYNLADLFRDLIETSNMDDLYRRGIRLHHQLNYNKGIVNDKRFRFTKAAEVDVKSLEKQIENVHREWDKLWRRMTILRVKLEFPHVNLPLEQSDIEIALELYIEKSKARSVFVDEMLCFLHDLKRKDDYKVTKLLLSAETVCNTSTGTTDDSVFEKPIMEIANTEASADDIPHVSHSTPKCAPKSNTELTPPSSPIKRRKRLSAIIVDTDDDTDDINDL